MNSLQKNSGILINGQFDANLPVMDRGLAYGDGVYRTFVVRQGTPLLWAMQYQKLLHDAQQLNLNICPAEKLLHEIQLLSADSVQCVIKVIITRGEGGRGYAIPANCMENRILILSEYPQYAEHILEHGAKIFLCELRLSHQPKLAGIKHLNRLENVLARSECKLIEFQDGLLLDQNDNVVECTSGNIFARFGNQLITPKLHDCGVAGVVRDLIIQQSHQWSLETQESMLTLSQLEQADEVFMTNSVIGAMNISQLNNITWHHNTLAKQIRKALGISA